MMEGILSWIVKLLLEYLFGKAATAVQEKAKELARDKERGEINEANVKAYEEAKDRESRRRAALDLVNGVHRT